MSEFEKKYYEAPEFWEEGALDNKANRNRVVVTTEMIPGDANSLADIGCGNGLFGNYLLASKPEMDVIGIDRSEMALSFVNTNKKIGDINDIPLSDESYDCVTCLQVLEHIPEPVYKTALKELARISRKYIIISVPYNENLKQNATECPKCLSEFNADLHLRSYSNDTVTGLFSSMGFKCISSKNIFSEKKYYGLDVYNKTKHFFFPLKKSFNSPICPICGYHNEHFKKDLSETNYLSKDNKIVKRMFRLFVRPFKYVWPKKKIPGYWIIALYKRNDIEGSD